MRIIGTSFFLLLFINNVYSQTFTVSGHLTDGETGEALIYATVFAKGTQKGTTTNEYGFFSLTLPYDTFEIIVNYIGYEKTSKTVYPGIKEQIKFEVHPTSQTLKTFEIVAEAGEPKEELESTQMSTISIPIKEISKIPAIGGETDIIKVAQLLPGVQKGGEGGTAMFVRGGDADQNLVILDEATVYNVGHLFGFFSVFNPDVIKDMTLIKGAFPANYGGRLSSVLDLRTKEGNLKEFHGQGGIGLLSSRLELEGPLIKDKASFIISGRRTYIDEVFKLVKVDIPYYFYDINAKVNYKFSDKDRVYFSAYIGNDVLKINEDVETDSTQQAEGEEEFAALGFGFTLGNFTYSLRWNHVYSNKLFSNISLIQTSFDYNIQGEFLDNNLLIRSKINDLGVKADWDYYISPGHQVKFGASVVNHNFKPNVVNTAGEITDFLASQEGDLLQTQEGAIYAYDDHEFFGNLIKINAGLRISIADTKNRLYAGLEPRFGMRFSLSEKDALKLSYSKMFQYMHRVSSSSIALPTDLWYPVTENVKPQRADQVAMGITHHFPKIKSLITLEGYHKWMYNLIEYREGANLVLNDNFEEELLQGNGRSYGVELLLKKDEGRLTGWVGYTLAWANRTFQKLNDGETFPAKYDRRHNISVVQTLKLSKRWDFSAVWVFSSGGRFTPLIAQYLAPNATLTNVEIIPVYAKRNSVKLSDSHRLDVNFVRKPNPDKDRKWEGEVHFGAYNVYSRAAPYKIEIVTDDSGAWKYTQPGLFGFIFSVAYNFKF